MALKTGLPKPSASAARPALAWFARDGRPRELEVVAPERQGDIGRRVGEFRDEEGEVREHRAEPAGDAARRGQDRVGRLRRVELLRGQDLDRAGEDGPATDREPVRLPGRVHVDLEGPGVEEPHVANGREGPDRIVPRRDRAAAGTRNRLAGDRIEHAGENRDRADRSRAPEYARPADDDA